MPEQSRSMIRRLAVLAAAIVIVSGGFWASVPRIAAETAYTAVYLDGEVGEPLTNGRAATYRAPGDSFIGTISPDLSEVTVRVNVGDAVVILAAPPGEELAIGTYTGAVRSAFRGPGEPGIDIGGQGVGCNTTAGSFTVQEITVDGGGTLVAFSASFQQQCGNITNLLYGEVRYNATTSLKADELNPPTLDLGSVELGMVGAIQDVVLTATGTQPISVADVSVTGTNANDFAITADACSGASVAVGNGCTVSVRAAPNTAGPLSARLTFDDDTFRGSKDIVLDAVGVLDPSLDVSWGALQSAPNWSWTFGTSLGRTVSNGSGLLHATYATDRIGSQWARDSGPRVGVYYIRTGNGGSSWTSAKRLNPTTVHGARGSLATSGAYVYATWVSTKRWVNYSGKDPRVLYLRVNSSHGSPTKWSVNRRLTISTGRVDLPTIAAAGSHVYVAYTNSNTGAVMLKISHDRAKTWRTVTIGQTSYHDASGYSGWPRVSASGNLVGVSWTGTANATVRARVSTNAGTSWSAATALNAGANDISSSAATGTRFAVAWTAGHSRQGSSLGERDVVCQPSRARP